MMLMAAAALASCEKQTSPVEQKTQEESYVYTISAVAPDMVDESAPAQAPTRTDYTDKGVFSWSAGDAISVLFHNGDDNKFFTLTTSESGASVKFSGSIEAGYEIGASDGTVSDKKIWALFPASANHTYTAGSNPSFYVQPEVDYSATHYSANIPMYDLLASEATSLSFKNLASTYKFNIKNLDNSVNKVRILVSNQDTHGISGSWPIHADKYINYDYAEPGTAKSCLTYTANVSENAVSFYVSCRYYGNFRPIITIYDAETGFVLQKVTATKTVSPNYMNKIWPIAISAPGTGSPLLSAFGINWGSLDMYPADDSKDSYPGDGTRIIDWKVTSDATNIYFYYKTSAAVAQEKGIWNAYIVTGFDTDNDSDTGADGSYGLGAGFEARSIAYPFTNAAGDPVSFRAPGSPNSSSNIKCPISGSSLATVATNGSANGEYAYVEICIPREHIGSPASSATIRVRNAYGSTSCAAQTLTLQ